MLEEKLKPIIEELRSKQDEKERLPKLAPVEDGD